MINLSRRPAPSWDAQQDDGQAVMAAGAGVPPPAGHLHIHDLDR